MIMEFFFTIWQECRNELDLESVSTFFFINEGVFGELKKKYKAYDIHVVEGLGMYWGQHLYHV